MENTTNTHDIAKLLKNIREGKLEGTELLAAVTEIANKSEEFINASANAESKRTVKQMYRLAKDFINTSADISKIEKAGLITEQIKELLKDEKTFKGIMDAQMSTRNAFNVVMLDKNNGSSFVRLFQKSIEELNNYLTGQKDAYSFKHELQPFTVSGLKTFPEFRKPESIVYSLAFDILFMEDVQKVLDGQEEPTVIIKKGTRYKLADLEKFGFVKEITVLPDTLNDKIEYTVKVKYNADATLAMPQWWINVNMEDTLANVEYSLKKQYHIKSTTGDFRNIEKMVDALYLEPAIGILYDVTTSTADRLKQSIRKVKMDLSEELTKLAKMENKDKIGGLILSAVMSLATNNDVPNDDEVIMTISKADVVERYFKGDGSTYESYIASGGIEQLTYERAMWITSLPYGDEKVVLLNATPYGIQMEPIVVPIERPFIAPKEFYEEFKASHQKANRRIDLSDDSKSDTRPSVIAPIGETMGDF